MNRKIAQVALAAVLVVGIGAGISLSIIRGPSQAAPQQVTAQSNEQFESGFPERVVCRSVATGNIILDRTYQKGFWTNSDLGMKFQARDDNGKRVWIYMNKDLLCEDMEL